MRISRYINNTKYTCKRLYKAEGLIQLWNPHIFLFQVVFTVSSFMGNSELDSSKELFVYVEDV